MFEVSPVLVGANQSTYIAVKEQKEKDVKDVESGLRFTDGDNVLITINNFIDRAKELTSLRLEKGCCQSLSRISYADSRPVKVYNDLDNILGLGEEEAEQPKDNIDALWLNTQEVLARSQGVVNEGDKVGKLELHRNSALDKLNSTQLKK